MYFQLYKVHKITHKPSTKNNEQFWQDISIARTEYYPNIAVEIVNDPYCVQT